MDKKVVVEIDPRRRAPLNAIWRQGANTCHAPLWFRDDLLRHLEMCRDSLGFSRVRAHGSIGDGMATVQEDGAFSFDRLVGGLRRLLDIGYTPFLEISHMPKALAATDSSICRYRFGSSPPKDWGKWREFTVAMMAALVKAFGREELRRWDFEVWNEPDIAFWSGTMEEYFRLYDITAAAVKGADPEFSIGGPATARCKWITEFIRHLATPSKDFPLDGTGATRCDFVSTHAYPSDLEFLDAADGEVKLQESGVMAKLFGEAREAINQSLGADFRLVCGEWNSSAGPLAINHDECNNAAFIAKTLAELSDPFGAFGEKGICQGSLYWNLSDIYEECGFHHTPFHGGYGLITVNDIPKSSFRAFELLARHSGERMCLKISGDAKSAAAVGGLASVDEGKLVATFWHLREPGAENAAPVKVAMAAGAAGVGQRAELTRILPGRGGAYEAWVELGSPEFPTRQTLEKLEQASVMDNGTVQAGADGKLEFELPPGTVAQIRTEGY